jgi:hypothetical protein
VNEHIGNAKPAISLIESKLFELEKEKWKYTLVSDPSVSGNCGNKHRTYRLFKSDFESEKYLFKNMPFQYRSECTKFRLGVA